MAKLITVLCEDEHAEGIGTLIKAELVKVLSDAEVEADIGSFTVQTIDYIPESEVPF